MEDSPKDKESSSSEEELSPSFGNWHLLLVQLEAEKEAMKQELDGEGEERIPLRVRICTSSTEDNDMEGDEDILAGLEVDFAPVCDSESEADVDEKSLIKELVKITGGEHKGCTGTIIEPWTRSTIVRLEGGKVEPFLNEDVQLL